MQKEMSIEQKIKGLRRLKKNLEEIRYEIIPTGGGFNLKKGKYVVIPSIFSEEWAERIAGGFAAIHKKHADEISLIIKSLEQGYEQQSLSLFGGKNGNEE